MWEALHGAKGVHSECLRNILVDMVLMYFDSISEGVMYRAMLCGMYLIRMLGSNSYLVIDIATKFIEL